MDEHSSDFEDASTPRVHERIAQSNQDQEQQLDVLHTGVKRLKNQAIAVNDEVVQQNVLIDHIAVQVADADQAVTTQTQAAKKVVKYHQQVALIVLLSCFPRALVALRVLHDHRTAGGSAHRGSRYLALSASKVEALHKQAPDREPD